MSCSIVNSKRVPFVSCSSHRLTPCRLDNKTIKKIIFAAFTIFIFLAGYYITSSVQHIGDTTPSLRPFECSPVRSGSLAFYTSYDRSDPKFEVVGPLVEQHHHTYASLDSSCLFYIDPPRMVKPMPYNGSELAVRLSSLAELLKNSPICPSVEWIGDVNVATLFTSIGPDSLLGYSKTGDCSTNGFSARLSLHRDTDVLVAQNPADPFSPPPILLVRVHSKAISLIDKLLKKNPSEEILSPEEGFKIVNFEMADASNIQRNLNIRAILETHKLGLWNLWGRFFAGWCNPKAMHDKFVVCLTQLASYANLKMSETISELSF